MVIGLTEEEKKRRKRRKELLGLTDEELDALGEETIPEPEEAGVVQPLEENRITFQPIEGIKPLPESVRLPSERILREPTRPPQEEDLESLLERVYPEKFQPGVTSYGYTKKQLSPVVLEQAESAMQADFKGFQYDVYQRVGQDEGEKLLRALGANETAILQAYDANIQEQRIVNTVQAVLPEIGTLDQFQDLLDTEPKKFARAIREGGITNEKQQLLDLLGLQASEVEELLIDRIFTDVDGIRKQVIRDADNNVYDERGQWLGWYDWGENKVFNPYKETTLFGKVQASITAGIGDVLSTAGGAARWLGQEDIGATLSAKGKELQRFGQPSQVDFQISDLLDPEFYATKVARTIPFAVSLAPVAVGSFYAGSALAAAAGLGTLGTMLVASLGSGALSRAAEGALEAGGQYDDAIARGKTEAEAKKEADEVFTNNMNLAGWDAWQIAIALAPTPKWVPKALVNGGLVKTVRIGGKMVIVGLSEGGEEVYQSMIQRHAAGEEWRLDPVDKEVFAIGAVMGLGMGLGGDIVQSVVNKSKAQMMGDVRTTFDDALSGGKSDLEALNEVVKTPKGQSLIQKIIQDERGSIEIGPEGKAEVPKVTPTAPVTPKVTAETPLNLGRTQGNRLFFEEMGVLSPSSSQLTISEIVTKLNEIQAKLDKIPTSRSGGPQFRRLDNVRVILLKEAERESGLSETGLRNVAEGLSPPIVPKAIPKAEVKPTTPIPEAKPTKVGPDVKTLSDAQLWSLVQSPVKDNAPPELLAYLKKVRTEFDKRDIKLTPIIGISVKPTTTPSAAIEGQGVEAAGVKEALPKTMAEYNVSPYWRGKQSEFSKKMKPYHEQANAEIKQANDEFMAGKRSLLENDADLKAINKRLDEQADVIRKEMGFPTSKGAAEVPPVKPPEPSEAAVTPTPEPKPTPVQRVREFYKAKIADLEATTRDKITSLKDWAKYTVSERDRVKNILTDYIQEQLPLAERGKLLDAVKNVTNQAELDEVIARVDRLGEMTEQKRLRTEINEELAKTKPKKVEGILKGKYTAEFQDWLDTVRANIGMDRDEARARIAEIIQQHGENKISEDAMIEQVNMLRLAGIDGMSSAELQEVLTDIQDMKTIGRTLNQANQEKLKADIDTIKEKAVNEVTGNKGLKPGTGILDARELEAKTNFVGRLTDSQLAFGNLLDEISKLSGALPYQSELSKFERTVQEARNKENSGRKLYQQTIIQDFAKIYGLKKPGEINARLNQLENEKVDLGTFRVVIDGKAQQIHMVKTKAQIMQHYLWQQDPTLIDTYKDGMHWTYEINNAMANALNDQDVAFANSISQFYRDYYPSIDQIYKELYGVHLPNNPNYSPLLRDFDTAQPENVMLYKDLAHYASVLNGSLKSRVKNILPLHDTSVLANLINHVSQMEHFKAWSMPMRTMRRVFGDKTVRTAIQQYHGRPVMQKVDHYLDLFARGGVDRMQVIRGLDKLRGNFSTAVLGLKPHIAIQQIPTILGYTTEMPLGDFVEGVADFWKNPIQNYQWILKNSTYIQNRYEAGFERDIRTATTKKALTEWSGKGSFTEKMYALIEGGDKLGVIPGWWAKYKSALKHGLTQQAAMTEADLSTNRTQNTSDIETLSSVQNGGSWMKLLTMFQNQPNKYFRIMADNARNFKYGRGNKAKAISNILMVAVVLPALYSIIANAFRVRKDDLFKTAVFSPVNNLLIFGQMAQAIEGWISGETFGYNVSPVLDSMREIQNAFSKARKLVAAGQDPYKDIAIDDVIALTEFVAKAGGQVAGLPTPYLVNVERALRGTEGKRDLRELVFSRWALREPDKDVHEKLAESVSKLGQPIEYTQKQLDAMAKAGQKIIPKVTDMKVLDSDFRKELGNTLPVDITEKNGYSPMAVAWAQKEIARGQSDILPNIKLKDYFKDDYDDFSPRQYVEQYQASLRIKSLQELKEYGDVYPRYYLGNLTARQLEVMEKYATLSKPEQEKYLEAHPELSLNPRQEWLKAHSEENARLAIRGQVKVLTQAAYDNALRMINDLDIPDSAIEDFLPPKDVAKDYFSYNEAVDKFGANSPQARIVRLNDKLNGWMELERIDESPKSLELKVSTYDKTKEYEGFSDKDSPNYKDDVIKDTEGKTARDKAQESFKTSNQTWFEDLDRIEAHSKGTRDKPTPDDVVEKWAEHGKLAREKKGYEAEEKVWYLDNPTIHKWALGNGLTKDDGLKWNEPVLRIQVKPENRKMEAEREKLKGDEEALKKLMATKAGQAYQDDQNRIYAYQNNGKEFVETLVGYGKIAREFGGSSSEAKLFRVGDGRFNAWGTDRTFEGGDKWEPLDTTKVPVWRIDAEFRREDTEYQAILDKYDTGQQKEQDAAIKAYLNLNRNKDYVIARIQRGGYELGLKDVTKWTAYNQLPDSGFWRERYRRDNRDFDIVVKAAQVVKGQNPWADIDPKKIPDVRYDQIYQQYQDKFERYDNAEGTSEQRRQIREAMLKADPRFAEARLTRNAYGLLIGNERYVPDYVRYYKILSANLDLDNYEDDWYLMEHSAFYNTMLKALDWEPRDFSKVPTRRVWQKYQVFLTQPQGKARDDYRFDNPDLEAWLVLKFGYTPITEKRRRAEFTPKEKLAEEVEKRKRRLAGIGAR